MASITLLYAGILILLSVLLANQVLYVRLRGDKEPEWRDNTVQRVQSNFCLLYTSPSPRDEL